MMKRHNFTLIELLVAIAIVIILAGILIGGISFATGKADNAKTRALMLQMVTALEEYKSDCGMYPLCTTSSTFSLQIDSTSGKLQMVIGGTTYKLGRNPGFTHLSTSATEFQDAWDQPFHYVYPGTHNVRGYDLWSDGKSTSNTEDDITNWDNYN